MIAHDHPVERSQQDQSLKRDDFHHPLRRRPSRGSLIVSYIFIVVLLVALTPVALNVYDEGIILTGTLEIMRGHLPHRDFYVNYGPLQFLILGGAFKTWGISVFVHRITDAAIKALCVVLVYLISERLSSRWLGLVAAMLTFIWLAASGFPGYPLWLSIALSLALVDGFDRGTRTSLVIAGLVSGLLFLTRYDIGLAAIGLFGVMLCVRCFQNPSTGKGFVKRLAPDVLAYTCGVSVILLPVLVFFFTFGMMHDFIFQVFEFGAKHYPHYRSLPFPGLSAAWFEWSVYFPPLVLLCGVAALALTPPSRILFPTMILIMGFCILFYLKGIVRVSALHMSGGIIFAFILLTVSCSRLLAVTRVTDLARRAFTARRTFTARWSFTVGWVFIAAAVVVALVISAAAVMRSLPSSLAWSMMQIHVLHRSLQPGWERWGKFQISTDQAAALQFVAAHTPRDIPIFVASGRHDKLFVNDILFYFLANRAPVTKWYQFDPGLQTTDTIQSLIVSDLRNAGPVYVVKTTFADHVMEPNQSSRSSGVTILDDYIAAHCQEKWQQGSYSVLLCS